MPLPFFKHSPKEFTAVLARMAVLPQWVARESYTCSAWMPVPMQKSTWQLRARKTCPMAVPFTPTMERSSTWMLVHWLLLRSRWMP